MPNLYSSYRKIKGSIDLLFVFEGVYKLSALQILNGALKGLVMLQETYAQDIKDFSKGHFYLKNTIECTSRKTDSLQPDDLAAMSSLAFKHYNWYNNDLAYLEKSLNSYYYLSPKQRIGMLIDDLDQY